MFKSTMGIILVAGLAFPASLIAGESQHFSGAPADTLPQAMTNLGEYNQKLAMVLAADLDPTALSEVHQLTYSLENALARITLELDDLTQTLEAVHQASEHADPSSVQQQGARYLEKARQLQR